jgi:hypothetical protein
LICKLNKLNYSRKRERKLKSYLNFARLEMSRAVRPSDEDDEAVDDVGDEAVLDDDMLDDVEVSSLLLD